MKLPCLIITSFSFLMSATLWASDPIEETRTTLKELIETKRIITAEESSWKLDQELLQSSIELLKKEIESLDASIKELEEASTTADNTRNERVFERAELRRAMTFVEANLPALETRVLELANRFPAPLREKLEQLLVRIPREPDTTNVQVGARLQNILGILTIAEKFNRTITITQGTRDLGGPEKTQVYYIFWGLAQAFYVDTKYTKAGRGTPSAATGEWNWSNDNPIAPILGQLIQIYENEAEPEFVMVPVTIQ